MVASCSQLYPNTYTYTYTYTVEVQHERLILAWRKNFLAATWVK